jgi:CheY-like chemotaxis protein
MNVLNKDINVLIVDDNPSFAASVEHIVSQGTGFGVHATSDPDEALDIVRSSAVSACLAYLKQPLWASS